MGDVRRIGALAVASSIALMGCHPGERLGTCAPVQGATRVVIHVAQDGNAQRTDRIVTDPEQIRQLIVFANARREVFQPQLYTMPAPRITATFYENAEFLGSIGEGPNFLSMSCPQWHGIRKASESEVSQFKRLVGDVK
jgi:hypothetical protein